MGGLGGWALYWCGGLVEPKCVLDGCKPTTLQPKENASLVGSGLMADELIRWPPQREGQRWLDGPLSLEIMISKQALSVTCDWKFMGEPRDQTHSHTPQGRGTPFWESTDAKPHCAICPPVLHSSHSHCTCTNAIAGPSCTTPSTLTAGDVLLDTPGPAYDLLVGGPRGPTGLDLACAALF